MHRKALDIEVSLGRFEGIANQCGNLGVIHARRGDSGRARESFTRAREVFGKLGMSQAINMVQSLIDGLPQQ